MQRIIVVAAAVSLVSITGCLDSFTGCAGVGAFGIEVTVVDSLSGAPAAAGAVLLTYDLANGGARVDSILGQSDTDVLGGADDRAGNYSVYVRKAGYRDWTRAEVVVRDGCPAVKTVHLTARLARP